MGGLIGWKMTEIEECKDTLKLKHVELIEGILLAHRAQNVGQLLQNVGINISYCILTPVRGGDWFHQSIVDSYLAAAGNDIDTFMKWMNEGHGFDHFDETFNEDNSIIAKMFEAQKLHRE